MAGLFVVPVFLTFNDINELTKKYSASNHTVLLSDFGDAFSFGNNQYYQLGHETDLQQLSDLSELIVYFPPPKLTPERIEDLNGLFIKNVACGNDYTVFVDGNGDAWSVGRYYEYQLGRNGDYRLLAPINLPDDSKPIIDVACGIYHTVLVGDDGRVWSFGKNDDGQLGRSGDQTIPQLIPTVNDIIGVACSFRHTVLVGRNGKVWSFGANDKGQLGRTGDPEIPELVNVPGNELIKGVACGEEHTVLVGNNGKVWSFGNNDDGQLGRSGMGNVPGEVIIDGSGLIDGVSCGMNHTVLVDENRIAWSFGKNDYGQLGIGNIQAGRLILNDSGTAIIGAYPRPLPPRRVLLPDDFSIIGFTCGNDHTVFVGRNGDVLSVGDNTDYQLGREVDADNPNDQTLPHPIPYFTEKSLFGYVKSARPKRIAEVLTLSGEPEESEEPKEPALKRHRPGNQSGGNMRKNINYKYEYFKTKAKYLKLKKIDF